ncbi:pyruvate kinase [Chondrus crispus]|uniref:Pyruvate kinase n=1 Tax=Chondrus crispus TaxID=2769 RepID=R7Q566_CHOCR|nr:pyruvate kinase [Chondrus crispus]CDF32491.1 pyruvate kinase [Chondrus crispus]|eukprot:XP_005712156.1 pyruvate kinase [Chondrus crispus]
MSAFLPPSALRPLRSAPASLQSSSFSQLQSNRVAQAPKAKLAARWHMVVTGRNGSQAPSTLQSSGGFDLASGVIDDKLWDVQIPRMSKIVCTIGPKTCDIESIEKLAETGMDIVRLNMSHGTHEWHGKVIETVREVNSRGRFNLGLLLDTKGPEVRSGDLKAPIQVKRGQKFTWTVRKDFDSFDDFTVDVSYDDFVKDVHVGDTLLVDGGMCSFLVTEVTDKDVLSECIDGGTLTSRRHLNVRGKSASLPAITEKDWEDIKFGMENNVDFYALSFVKHEDDVQMLISYLRENNSLALVLSKIESADAVKRLRPILEASDGAMVARGDLGAEIPVEDVPLVQDEIVSINRSIRKPTIVATHMLESMITYPSPTRAEVADITEAVRQGADATMLSGETANGSYPYQALSVMATVAESVVSQDSALSENDLFSPVLRMNESKAQDARLDLAFGASTMASRLNVAAIVVFTRVGTYAKLVSCTRPRCPIIAFTPDEDLVRRLTLYWGVKPFELSFSEDPEETISRAVKFLIEKGLTSTGDTLVIASDMLVRDKSKVNTIQVRTVH